MPKHNLYDFCCFGGELIGEVPVERPLALFKLNSKAAICYRLKLLSGNYGSSSSLKQKVDLGTRLISERGLSDLRDHVGVSVAQMTVAVLNHLD